MERQKDRQLTEYDKQVYLNDVKNRIMDSRVIALVQEDLEQGLLPGEINDYTDRGLSLEQMKAVSDMYRKEIPMSTVAILGAKKYDAEKMKVATELYLKQIPVDDIVKALEDTTTALDMRKAFSLALGKVQTAIAISNETMEKEPMEKNQAEKLAEMIGTLTQAMQTHTGNYETLEKMMKEMETIRLDEAVAKNLTSLNAKLEKENREFSEQLEKKQDEVNKGLQSMAKLRTEVENLKEEMKIMQEKNTDLENQLSIKNETIGEQSQAILAKEKEIENYKQAAESKLIESHSENPDAMENGLNADKESLNQSYHDKSEGVANHNINDGYAVSSQGNQAVTMPTRLIPVYASADGIPVYYAMTLVQDKNVIQRTDIDYMHRKPSMFDGIMSKFAFRKKSHKDLMQLVIHKELSSEQINIISEGLKCGLDEEQLELIINKNLTPEKMQSIISFAALQNSLKAERGGLA